MLKALFLDLDETLCDTTSANLKARDNMAENLKKLSSHSFDSFQLASNYLTGIYRVFDSDMKEALLPIRDEEEFRTNLLEYLFNKHAIPNNFNRQTYHDLRAKFDEFRLDSFDFFPGVKELIAELRSSYKLIVITNGPVYSQRPKVKKLNLRSQVDHVIIGGEEPKEKPCKSIFMKACTIAECQPEEAIHIGDSLKADIAGASDSGINSVWISPDLKQNPLPTHTISNFIHIKSVLDSYK